MIRESEIRDLNYLHHQNEEVQQDTPIIKPLQNSSSESNQLPLQIEQKQINHQTMSFGQSQISMHYKQQPFRQRKSTFQRQYEEQAAVEFAAGGQTNRDYEDEEYENHPNSKGSRQYIISCTNLEQKSSFSSKCWKNIQRYLIILINFFANKSQKFTEKEREEKFVQVKLESTYESFVSIQWCLSFSYLALFIINISKNQFSSIHSVSSTSQNQYYSQQQNINQSSLDYSLSEVIIQLIISLINFILICFSKSKKLLVRGVLIIIQLAEIVYLEKLLFGDFNNYFHDNINSQDQANMQQKSQQLAINGNSDPNIFINSWDIYVELRYELLKSLFLMIACFLLVNNMVGWNYRFLYSSILICVFAIILFNKDSFWLFITSLVILTILFNFYFYHEEKKNRQTFIELQSFQDKNSPSLYNMIHEQISSGLIVVTRSQNNANKQGSNNQYLQLKFANKISFEQLQCCDENEILQKFREISVKSELAASQSDQESDKESIQHENEEGDNIDIAGNHLKMQKNKHQDHIGQPQTLYDKLVCYIDEIYRIQELQNNINDNRASMNSLIKQPSNSKQASNIYSNRSSKVKRERSSLHIKKTNSMIQLGKSDTFRKLKQHSSTIINKARSQTPKNQTLIKANFSSNRMIGTHKHVSSEYSIKKKNSIATPNFTDLHQKINQFSGSRLDDKRNENNANSEIKFKRKGSFINMNAVISQFSPKNNTNGFSPVRGKSSRNGIEEGIIDSQNKGSNLKLKAAFSQVSEQKNINSPSIYNISPKKGQERRQEKSSFGQLIYGVMKSSTYENQQQRNSGYDSVDTPAKDSLINKNSNNINSFINHSNNANNVGTNHKKQKLAQNDEEKNENKDKIQLQDRQNKNNHSSQKSNLKQTQKKKHSDNNESDDEGHIQMEEEEEENSIEKGRFTRSMIQVQIPSNEMYYQQFDFKINQIEWDNAPALIILVTDSTEKLMNEKLKELEVYKEELLHTMQHISRTPLNSIINISEILLNEYFKQYKMSNSINLLNNIAINSGSILQNNQLIANFQQNQNQQPTNQQNNNFNFNINTVNAKYFKQGSTNSIINAYNGTVGENTNNFPTLNQHNSNKNQNNLLENLQSNNSNYNNIISTPNTPININDHNNLNELNSNDISLQKINNNALPTLQEKQLSELETVVQNLHIIKNNGLILLHTINTVTDLSIFQTNQGQLNIDPETFSLQNIIEEIKDLYLHQIQEKKLSFSIQVPQHLERITSDKKRVIQVLFEIIGNAIKYTNDGSIQIKIKEQEKGIVWVKVQDSGQGMSESLKHSLFSNKLIQYYSRERDFSRKNSAGLGLDFSRKIVGILGPFYQIFIKSAEGVGSCFKFLLYTDYNERQNIDIPQLRQRIMMLQNQGNDQAGGIFTPDIIGQKKNRQQDNKNNSESPNTNQLNSNQVLIKKNSDHSQQSNFQQQFKKNTQCSTQHNNNNSKIYNSCGIGVLSGQSPNVAVSDVAEVDELISSFHIHQQNMQSKKDNNQDQMNYFSGSIIDKEQKSNVSTLKQSNPQLQKQKYFSIDYNLQLKYRFPLSANYNQISHHDLDQAQSSMIGGSKSKKRKKQIKNQVFNNQFKTPPQMIDTTKYKVQNSEQMIPCIEINDDVEQRYNREDDENELYKNNNNAQNSQNKFYEDLANNSNSKNKYQNNAEYYKNKQQNNDESYQNYQTKININQNNDNENINKKQFNTFQQNMQQKLNSLNNSQNLSDDSVTTAGGGQCIQQSQSIEQSGIIPKKVYNSSSTHPNNLRNLGPSIFMKVNPSNSTYHNSLFLNTTSINNSNNKNINIPSHQRLEMNQILKKNDINDIENQEPLPELSFIDNTSPEIQNKQDSIDMDKNSPSQKIEISPKAQQVSQLNNQHTSPMRKIKLERKETRNPSMICQTLKIDDYDQMLSLTFQEKSYVLGIDDNIMNLNILEMYFKKCSNIIFHKAGNGQQCIEKALWLKQTQNAYYKAFLMDIQMPIMDGYQAHKELKKLMKKKIIEYSPVFAVTAYSNEKSICIQQGMQGFIEKPINMKVLINLIYEYFTKNKNNQKQNSN